MWNQCSWSVWSASLKYDCRTLLCSECMAPEQSDQANRTCVDSWSGNPLILTLVIIEFEKRYFKLCFSTSPIYSYFVNVFLATQNRKCQARRPRRLPSRAQPCRPGWCSTSTNSMTSCTMPMDFPFRSRKCLTKVRIRRTSVQIRVRLASSILTCTTC